jgi:hypothetical protein
MKLSKETLAIMKNFAGINANLMLKNGNKISTISPAKSVMAVAQISENLPINGSGNFGIYELNDFLSAYTLMEDPDLTFADNFCMISKGHQKIKFYSAASEMLLVPSKESLPVSDDVSFNLKATDLDMISKSAAILKVSDISIVSKDGKVSVEVADKKAQQAAKSGQSTANTFNLDIGTSDKEFKVNMKVDNLQKIVLTDYVVTVDSKKLSKFSATKGSLVYYIAIESDSVIGK